MTSESSGLPEERELAKKRSELDRLETELAERELDLATLENELRAFEWRYLKTIGSLYAELDELEAQIAEAIAQRDPADGALKQRAVDARAQATYSSDVLDAAQSEDRRIRYDAPDTLKKLYRDVARRIHPDLAPDDSSRTRRDRLMAEANDAYAVGDETKLRAILDEWESSPEAVEGLGVAADLVRTIRKIHRAEARIATIAEQLTELKHTPLYELMERVIAARSNGQDLLSEMAEELERQIDEARRTLLALSSREAT